MNSYVGNRTEQHSKAHLHSRRQRKQVFFIVHSFLAPVRGPYWFQPKKSILIV